MPIARYVGIAFAGFIAIGVGAALFSGNASGPTSTQIASVNASHRERTRTRRTVSPTAAPMPEPTQESYEHQRQREKHEFLAAADESITGAMIAGNKFKYVGQDVDLRCTVQSIPDASFFNASCGEDADGLPATIVVKYDATDLQQGQSVRILGTVDDPMEGTNGFGGQATFPTVDAKFME